MTKTGKRRVCRECGTSKNLMLKQNICYPCNRSRSKSEYARHKQQIAEWKPPVIEACGFEFDEAVCPMRQKAARYRHMRGQKVQILACLACDRKVENKLKR